MSAPPPDVPPDADVAPSSDIAADLDLALRLADTADAITLPRFRAADLRVDRKPDRTPVTDADTACEDALRDVLARERPADAVLGEERGSAGSAARCWVLDPIDGTKNFSRGMPVWGSLIALVVDGRPVVGVVSAPALGRRWWAGSGLGASTRDLVRGVDGERLGVSAVAELGDAYVSTTDPDLWRATGREQGWLGLSRAAWESRAFGDCYQHCLVAEGVLDVAVEPAANPWDLAAPMVVVTEAGGRVTDLAGADRHDGGTGVSTNGRLHDAVLATLGG